MLFGGECLAGQKTVTLPSRQGLVLDTVFQERALALLIPAWRG